MRPAKLFLGLLALALLLPQPSAAAVTPLPGSPLLLLETGDGYRKVVDYRQTVAFAWTLYNGGPSTYFVNASVANPDPDYAAVVRPARFLLGPGGSQAIEVLVSAPAPRRLSPATMTLVVAALDLAPGGTATEALATFTVEPSNTTGLGVPEGKILGRYENFLPPPLDNNLGAFLLSVALYALAAGAVAFLAIPIARGVAKRTKTKVDDLLLGILKGPVVLLVVAYGAVASLEILGVSPELDDLLGRAYGAVAILGATWITYKVFREILIGYLERVAARTETALDDQLLPVFEKLGALAIVLAGGILVLQALGYDVTLFLAGVGALGLILGIAARDTLSNFFSGIHLLLDRPFRRGDLIVLDTGEVCEVRDVGMRSTKLYDARTHDLIIMPNDLMANRKVVNLMQPDARIKVTIDFGVAYGSNLALVRRAVLEEAVAHPHVLKEPPHEPLFRFNAFGESSLECSLICFVDDVRNQWATASDLREALERRFRKEGIEIPFPQRVVWVKGEGAKGGLSA